MGINNIKNDMGYTAYETGKIIINPKFDYIAVGHHSKLDTLLFREHQIKFESLNKELDKLKSEIIGIKKL